MAILPYGDFGVNRPFSVDASDAGAIGIKRDSSGFSPPLFAVLGYRVHRNKVARFLGSG
jgi:hypothetical protein